MSESNSTGASQERRSVINVADIVESNGRTVRENNTSKKHDIPIGTLVEVKYNTWFNDGACEKVHARLWVVGHSRDCDGTPLYNLSRYKDPMYVDGSLRIRGEEDWYLKKEAVLNVANDVQSGYGRESLKVITVTEDLKAGRDALYWSENEKAFE